MIKRVMTPEGLVVTDVPDNSVEVNEQMKQEIKGMTSLLKRNEKEITRLKQSEAEINRLADFLQTFYPLEIGKGMSESAVDVAIQILQPKEAVKTAPDLFEDEKEVEKQRQLKESK